MSLTDTKARNAKPAASPYKLSDEKGLYLYVQPNGSKLWRLAYRFAGKQKTLALGVYGKGKDEVSLEAARDAMREAKALLKAGTDPGQQKKLDRIAAATAAADTFEAIANEWLAKQIREGRSDKTMARNNRLAAVAKRDLGTRPIRKITPPEALEALRKFEVQGKHETASRLKVFLSAVFRYAIATGRAENDPTIPLRGALTAPATTSRAAILDPVEFGGLLRAVWSYKGQPEVMAALKLMPLLYPRPSELRLAEWQEFDLDGATWTIPAPRTKMRRELRKPLPAQAVEILNELHRLTGNGKLVFPGLRSRLRPISDGTLNAALRRLGYAQEDVCSHGFRATASTLLNESGLWSPDAIERELGHLDGNAVRAAYARTQYWEERGRMAAWWADTCDHLREGKSFSEKVAAEIAARAHGSAA